MLRLSTKRCFTGIENGRFPTLFPTEPQRTPLIIRKPLWRQQTTPSINSMMFSSRNPHPILSIPPQLFLRWLLLPPPWPISNVGVPLLSCSSALTDPHTLILIHCSCLLGLLPCVGANHRCSDWPPHPETDVLVG